MSDPVNRYMSQWDLIPGTSGQPPVASAWDMPASPDSPAHHEPLQGGVEDLLDRLKAAETRRAGAMARLESMLDQWSVHESAAGEPSRAPSAVPPPPAASAPAAEPASPLTAIERDNPAQVISIVCPPDSGAPLLAFEPEAVNRTQTGMFLRAHGIKRRPEGAIGEVVPWRAESSTERERPDPMPRVEHDAPQKVQARDAAQTVNGRIDALELALVVAKGELDRVSRRHAMLQRRSLVSAFLVLLCAFLVGVLMMQTERRIADVRAQAVAAQAHADAATKQANELAAAVKRVTDSNELIPR